MLRIQTIRGTKTVWLSEIGDDASLNKLKLRDQGKVVDGDPQIVRTDWGTEVYILQRTGKRCRGRNVFVKVQIRNGNHEGLEGWICEGSITHRKVVGL